MRFDAIDFVMIILVTAFALFLGGSALAGGIYFYQTTQTGPCAHAGGVSNTAQDYIYCGNGSRVSTKPDDTRTMTIQVQSR